MKAYIVIEQFKIYLDRRVNMGFLTLPAKLLTIRVDNCCGAPAIFVDDLADGEI